MGGAARLQMELERSKNQRNPAAVDADRPIIANSYNYSADDAVLRSTRRLRYVGPRLRRNGIYFKYNIPLYRKKLPHHLFIFHVPLQRKDIPNVGSFSNLNTPGT